MAKILRQFFDKAVTQLLQKVGATLVYVIGIGVELFTYLSG